MGRNILFVLQDSGGFCWKILLRSIWESHSVSWLDRELSLPVIWVFPDAIIVTFLLDGSTAFPFSQVNRFLPVSLNFLVAAINEAYAFVEA